MSVEAIASRSAGLSAQDRSLLLDAASHLRQLAARHTQVAEPARNFSVELRDWAWMDGEADGRNAAGDLRWQPFVLEASLDPSKALCLRLQPKQGGRWAPPIMEVGIEINQGLPCIHLSADDAEGVALAVFAMPDGSLKTRPADGRTEIVRTDWMPDSADAAAFPSPEAR